MEEAPMLDLSGLAVVVLTPPVLLSTLLLVSGRLQRARADTAARQVAVTDAIHRELGAVVAPVMRRRGWRAWELRMALPLERPNLVGPVLAAAHRSLAGFDRPGPDRVRIVLVPRG
jgi:hypothetical protein